MLNSIKLDWYVFTVGTISALLLLDAWIFSNWMTLLLLAILTFIRYVYLQLDADFLLSLLEKIGKSKESLEGKVVWVTGASSGIGYACAKEFAQCKCKLVLSARSGDKLRELKELCVGIGGLQSEDVLVVPFDITDYSAHQPAFDKVMNHFGNIDILLSNAGSSQRAKWEEIDIAVDKQIFDVNVFGGLSLARIVTKYFIKQGTGHHAVVTSVAGKIGAPRTASYCGTKFALHGYFEALRAEQGTNGVVITMLAIGPVESNLMNLTYGEKDGQRGSPLRKSVLMTSGRCADLVCAAIANHMTEAWISIHPALLFLHLHSWAPYLLQWLMTKINFNDLANKARDGKNH